MADIAQAEALIVSKLYNSHAPAKYSCRSYLSRNFRQIWIGRCWELEEYTFAAYVIRFTLFMKYDTSFENYDRFKTHTMFKYVFNSMLVKWLRSFAYIKQLSIKYRYIYVLRWTVWLLCTAPVSIRSGMWYIHFCIKPGENLTYTWITIRFERKLEFKCPIHEKRV